MIVYVIDRFDSQMLSQYRQEEPNKENIEDVKQIISEMSTEILWVIRMIMNLSYHQVKRSSVLEAGNE